ncbi:MAG: WD40 repeat domain-containing protein, partial [Candidatus Xenobia bacterium]
APDLVELWRQAAGYSRRSGLHEAWMSATLQAHGSPALQLHMTVDGNRALSLHQDGTVMMWDLVASRPLHTWKLEDRAATACAIDGMGRCIAIAFDSAGQKSGSILLEWLDSGEHCFIDTATVITGLRLSLDGRLLVASGHFQPLQVYSLLDGVELLLNRDGSHEVHAMTADGRLVASASPGGRIAVLNLEDGSFMGAAGHEKVVRAQAFSSDGRHLVSVGDDRTAKSWTVRTPLTARALPGGGKLVPSLALTLDGRFALGGQRDGSLLLFALDARGVSTVVGRHDTLSAVALSADGYVAVTAGSDGSLVQWRLEWDLAVWEELDPAWMEAVVARFLHRQTPVTSDGSVLVRQGVPSWDDVDWACLVTELHAWGLAGAGDPAALVQAGLGRRG